MYATPSSTSARDLRLAEAPVRERGLGVGSRGRGGARSRPRCAAEPRRGHRQHPAVGLVERIPRDVVRVPRRLVEVEDGREAHLRSLEHRLPFRPRPAREGLGERLADGGPALAVRVVCELRTLQVEQPQQLRVEARLETPDRDDAAVRGRVHVVEGSAAVEQVRTALRRPEARIPGAVDHRHEERRPVGHRSVDHLSAAGAPRLEDRAHDAEREQHSTAAEVPDEVERRHRELPGTADRAERTRERDVVQVVPGAARPVGRPGPSRSCGRRRVARSVRGRRPARGRGAPSRRVESPRSAHPRARPTGARRLPHRRASGRARPTAGRGRGRR